MSHQNLDRRRHPARRDTVPDEVQPQCDSSLCLAKFLRTLLSIHVWPTLALNQDKLLHGADHGQMVRFPMDRTVKCHPRSPLCLWPTRSIHEGSRHDTPTGSPADPPLHLHPSSRPRARITNDCDSAPRLRNSQGHSAPRIITKQVAS